MVRLIADSLTDKERYKLLSGTIIPRPIALVTTLHENKEVNLAPFSFFNVVSNDPALVSISFQRKNGQMKDTAANVLRSKQAVIHIVNEDILSGANAAAKLLEPGVSELSDTGFTLAQSETVAVPYVKEAKIRFETELYDHIEIKNEAGHPTADLILFKVVSFDLDESVYQDTYVQADALKPIGRLAGNHYVTMGETVTIKRPV